MKEKAQLQRQIAQQAAFIELMSQRFQSTLAKSLHEEPMYSYHPIANRTQLCADARRIRREFMELIKLMEENAQCARG